MPDFVPIVIETLGGIGPKGQAFMKELAAWTFDNPYLLAEEIVKQTREAIAIALQKGNAAAIKAGYRNAIDPVLNR